VTSLTDTYWLGYRHGQRVAEAQGLYDMEDALKREVALVGTSNRPHRAFALGELRGYRQATDRPHVLAHRVLG
jgi:hypothetical protein